MSVRYTLKAAVLTAAFFMAGSLNLAVAGTFQVTPVRVELSAHQSTTALTVSNNGGDPVVIQLQISAWAQENGNDQYSSTDDLIATPPIFTIQPGANQIVRIGMRRQPDANTELSYRLYMQEVPPAPAPGFRGLQMALRIGIPVFVQSTNKATPDLAWTVAKIARDQLRVVLKNQGKAHLQVTDFSLNLPGQDKPLAVQQVSSYLLPMQEHAWTLPIDPAQPVKVQAVHATAFTDAGKLEADVNLDKP